MVSKYHTHSCIITKDPTQISNVLYTYQCKYHFLSIDATYSVLLPRMYCIYVYKSKQYSCKLNR